MNQLILVGKIVEDLILEENENNVKSATCYISVPRNFKNDIGEYENDIIPVSLNSKLAEMTSKYCKKGDTLGVHGRVSKLKNNDLQIIANKISFLTSKKPDDEDLQ